MTHTPHNKQSDLACVHNNSGNYISSCTIKSYELGVVVAVVEDSSVDVVEFEGVATVVEFPQIKSPESSLARVFFSLSTSSAGTSTPEFVRNLATPARYKSGKFLISRSNQVSSQPLCYSVHKMHSPKSPAFTRAACKKEDPFKSFENIKCIMMANICRMWNPFPLLPLIQVTVDLCVLSDAKHKCP